MAFLWLELQVADLALVGLVVQFVGAVEFRGHVRDILRIGFRLIDFLRLILLLTTFHWLLVLAFTSAFANLRRRVLTRGAPRVGIGVLERIGLGRGRRIITLIFPLLGYFPQLFRAVALSLRGSVLLPGVCLIAAAGLYKVSCRGLPVHLVGEELDALSDLRRESQMSGNLVRPC